MTVNPGYGAQKFLPEVLLKIERLRSLLDSRHLSTEIAVDGGINLSTARSVVSAGADVLIAGTAIFADPNGPTAAIRDLRQAASA
jgi:ribulose-phosphate 3-epimerase